MNVPDAIEEVTGYRIWEVTEGGRLRSYNDSFGHWNPGANEALCMVPPQYVRRNGPEGLEVIPLHDDHGPIPDERCECGFWFFRTIKEIHERNLLRPPSANYFTVTIGGSWGPKPIQDKTIGKVAGHVKGWGRVVVAEKGYRSQYAEITALLVSGDEDQILRDAIDKAATRYGVEVHKTEALKRKPERHPWEMSSFVYTTSAPVTWHSTGTGFASFDPAVVDEDPEPTNPVERKAWRKKRHGEALEQMRNRKRNRGQLP